MKRIRVTIAIVFAVLVIVFILLSWYKMTYSMEVTDSREINSNSAPVHLLIAAQGSEYKNALVEKLITKIENDSIYIRIIDVTSLDEVQERDWRGIIIIHTWENWKPQPDVETFVNRISDKSKLIMLATSGRGDNKIEGVDGIAAASKINNVDKDATRLADKVQALLTQLIE